MQGMWFILGVPLQMMLQTLLLKINDALVNLGWTKYDNAGAASPS